MKLVIESSQQIARLAAQQYVDLLAKKPNAVLGFATGSTPLELYSEIIRLNQAGAISFRDATSFNLDEYLGIDASHDQSYRYFMNTNLFEKIDIPLERTFLPTKDVVGEKDLSEYDNLIAKAGGIDIQLLGIGHNGHIGFNEPDTPFDSLTHVAELTESTVQANARFFASADHVPRTAATMGIQSVTNARAIIIIALGKGKAEIVKAAIQGPVTESVPATVLQRHPNVTWYLDQEAASLL